MSSITKTRNTIIFITILVLHDFSLGTILEYFYFRQKSGLMYRTTYAMDSTRAETLIFGSSRANHHYVPDIFEDSLQTSYYNTGRDGNFILYNYAVFKAIITRYHPRRVIFDINPDEFIYSIRDYERLSNLLPYYQRHHEIRDLILLRSPMESVKLWSRSYPYNSMLTTMAVGNMEFNKTRKADRKGYVALFRIMKDRLPDSINTNESSLPGPMHLDENKIKVLNDIVKSCRDYNISLYFIQSPRFIITGRLKENEYFAGICRENQVRYYDFSQSPFFLASPDLFSDPGHLNDDGARELSNQVVQLIKNAE